MKKNEQRQYFSFFRNIEDRIRETENAAGKEAGDALRRNAIAYGLDREEPEEVTGMVKIIWNTIKDQIDTGWKNYENAQGTRRDTRDVEATSKRDTRDVEAYNNKKKKKEEEKEYEQEEEKEKEKEQEKKTAKAVIPQRPLQERKEEFIKDVEIFLTEHPEYVQYKDDFIAYWTEDNAGDHPERPKMRKELEKCFAISRRFKTWCKNDKKFNKYDNRTRQEQNIIEAQRAAIANSDRVAAKGKRYTN